MTPWDFAKLIQLSRGSQGDVSCRTEVIYEILESFLAWFFSNICSKVKDKNSIHVIFKIKWFLKKEDGYGCYKSAEKRVGMMWGAVEVAQMNLLKSMLKFFLNATWLPYNKDTAHSVFNCLT